MTESLINEMLLLSAQLQNAVLPVLRNLGANKPTKRGGGVSRPPPLCTTYGSIDPVDSLTYRDAVAAVIVAAGNANGPPNPWMER
jgi:hypothetical protein